MLDIVVSYHWVQFQGTKFEKMAKKTLVLYWILIHLAQIRAVTFFSKIWLRHSLGIMVSYHNVQYQKKIIIRS